MNLTRRHFNRLGLGFAGAAALSSLPACSATQRRGRRPRPDEPVGVGVVGVRSRGMGLANSFQNIDGVEVVVFCDCDAQVLERQRNSFAEKYGHRPDGEADIRAMLDRDDIHAVVIATPNHWHALMTMWACEAGKDVYVEKPVCFDLREGQAMVEVANRTGRVVQTGTQARSSKAVADAIAYVNGGAIGAPLYARGTCWKPRKSIGRVAGPQAVPSHVDYDMWTGPAPMKPLKRRSLHYDWHWDSDTGNGDLGNQGIHQVDVCRWMLGEPKLARGVVSIGGRLGYHDDGDTPNSQVIVLDYETAPLIFEVRGLPKDKAEQAGKWGMDSRRGSGITAALQCEAGELVAFHAGGHAAVFDAQGNKVKDFRSGTPHAEDFIKAVRQGDPGMLSAPIEGGRVSSTLCHQGNASHALGRPGTGSEAVAVLGDFAGEQGQVAAERLCTHLRANEVDIDRPMLTVGAVLAFDPVAERHVDRPDADDVLERPARATYSHAMLT